MKKARFKNGVGVATKETAEEPIAPTDVGNGQRFAQQHGHKAKFIHKWDKWLVWNGRHWEIDERGEVDRLAKQTALSIYAEAAGFTDSSEAKKVATWAHQSQSRARITSMLEMAKSEEPIPLDYRSLDSDGWQLNCDNGTYDLKRQKLDKHRPADFITMTTGIEYPGKGANCPLWLQFLNDVLGGDAKMIAYVQRLSGLALIGQVIEHILPIAYGIGCNGKTVFCETIRAVMGDYAMTAPYGFMMAKRNQGHPTEKADLFRRRFVVVSETEDGARFDEGLVKHLTGGEALRARRMHEDSWQFDPTHTLLLVTNHKPIVRGRDVGIWRRIRLIPFKTQIPPEKQDKQLTVKLKIEHPAILAWMIQGCADWQRDGLQEPDEVKLATEEYKADQDVVGSFIDDCCLVGGSYSVKSKTLYDAYQDWCKGAGEQADSNRKFKAALIERGFETKKNVTNYMVGLTLAEV